MSISTGPIERGLFPSGLCFKLVSVVRLFEHILLHLPTESILTLQRVCHCFKNMIDQNTVIRQHLFLRPCFPTKLDNSEAQLNPLLEKCFPPWFG